MIVERVVVDNEHSTISLLIWRRFRRPMPGLIEKMLGLNPGLAAAGPVLPLGTTLVMPVPAPPPPAAVRLW